MPQIVLGLLLLTPLQVDAGAETAPNAPAPESAETSTTGEPAPSPAAVEEALILVMDLERSEGVAADVVATLESVVALEVSRAVKLRTLSGTDLKNMLALEGEREAMGCEGDSCLAQIANALGARYVVFGRLGLLERELVLQLQLLDAEKGAPVAREQVSARTSRGLAQLVPFAVRSLLSTLGAEVIARPEIDEDEGSPLGTLLLIGGGAAAAVGAAVVGMGVLALGGGGGGMLLLVDDPEARNLARIGFIAGLPVAAVGALLLVAGGVVAGGSLVVE